MHTYINHLIKNGVFKKEGKNECDLCMSSLPISQSVAYHSPPFSAELRMLGASPTHLHSSICFHGGVFSETRRGGGQLCFHGPARLFVSETHASLTVIIY